MSRSKGFTLVEMMVVIGVIGILLAIAVPNASIWMANMKIRNAAQSIKDGLVYAKTEAVRRNTRVQFVLTHPEDAGWQVVLLDDTELSRKATGEGGNRTIVTTPNDGDTVTFNGLGRVVANPEVGAGPTPAQFNVDSTVLAEEDSEELRVMVRQTGDIKMCNPRLVDMDDPKSCRD